MLHVLRIYPILIRIVSNLSAYHTSLLLEILGIDKDVFRKLGYLDLVRDVSIDNKSIQAALDKGCKIVLIGKDVPILYERLTNSLYWNRCNGSSMIPELD